jgi:hypothetical protein
MKGSYLKQSKFGPKPSNLHRMNYVPCGCDPAHTTPPGWLLDKIADEKLTGRFNVRRSNICPECHEARSVNGTCYCR